MMTHVYLFFLEILQILIDFMEYNLKIIIIRAIINILKI